MIKNIINNINSQCQIVFFNWNTPIVTGSLKDNELSATTLLDVSKYILSAEFSKNLGDPAGNFNITLPNDRDWKQILHPGTWGIIYMSQDSALKIPDNDTPSISDLQLQNNKVRGIIYIDRISVTGRVGEERGEYDAEFVISGRDFGVVYVENEIYYNRTLYESSIQDAAAGNLTEAGTKNVATLLDIIHRVFFSPEELGIPLLNGGPELQKDIPHQWLLPSDLFTVLGLKKRPGNNFFGNIDRDSLLQFDPTLCTYPVENPMTQIDGKAWDRLRSYSIEPFHELFTETNDSGQPNLIFRYIPWRNKGTSLGKLNGYVRSMNETSSNLGLPRVSIDSVDILDFDLGEENHNRYNYFFSTIDSSLYDANTTTQALANTTPRTGFPRVESNSIKRYGLRRMSTSVNALYVVDSERGDPELLRLHNELMLEYWNNSVFMESGTMTIIGRNDVKVGKVLSIASQVPYNGGKIFYIEGYTDHFSVDEKGAGFWTQSLTLSRGYYPGAIGKRGESYTDNGEFTKS